MSCENVQELISSLFDGKAPAEERENVLAHVGECRQCSAHLESLEMQRAMLRNMAQAGVPAALAAKLRVLASHERERQLVRASFGTRLRRWAWRVELAFDNMMRPVALPFTGGLLFTCLIFGLLMPSLSFSHQTGGHEFFTFPSGSIVTNPWDQGVNGDATDPPRFELPDKPDGDYVNIVNLTIDESGRVADWSVVRGQLTDEMKSIILLGRFQPATDFGVNTSGTIQVRQGLLPCKYRRCSATVRG
jgi:hypothetical protein